MATPETFSTLADRQNLDKCQRRPHTDMMATHFADTHPIVYIYKNPINFFPWSRNHHGLYPSVRIRQNSASAGFQ